MKLLSDRNIIRLFYQTFLFLTVFTLLLVVLVAKWSDYAVFYIIIYFICMGISLFVMGYRYFKEQNRIMENAILQIREYISGEQNIRIDCDEEGELYRLFHEINILVTILNTHAVKEKQAKVFLQSIISDISHQLKTPLAALNIYNGIIQEESDGHPTITEFTTLFDQELDRIEVLVQNLLKMAKLDAGTILLEKTIENVADMLSCVENHFFYRASQEKKEIILSGDDSVTLLCDRNWIIEAITNIVKNALDHTKRGGKIQIQWREVASSVQIIIKDNGTGIHPEDLYHIFKRFYRSRFSKDTKGIGLGLPLAKAIVEAHSGVIEVHSDLGSGTAFTINFLIPTKM